MDLEVDLIGRRPHVSCVLERHRDSPAIPAGGVCGQDPESILVRQLLGGREQGHEVAIHQPSTIVVAARAVPVGRGIDDEPVIAAAAADFAQDEPNRVIDDPANGTLCQSGEFGIAPGRLDGGSRGIDMGHPRACLRRDQREQSRVPEQVQQVGWCRIAAGEAGADGTAERVRIRRVLGIQPDLTARSQLGLEGHAGDGDRG